MIIWKKFLSLSKIRQITVLVWLIHFAAVAALGIHHLATRKTSPIRPISVRTCLPPAPIAQIHTPKKNEKPLPPAKKNVPHVKPKKEPKTVPAAPKKTIPTAKAESRPLLEEISASFDALSFSEPSFTKKESLTIPALLQPKTQLAEETTTQPAYAERLISFLQNALDLPEFGEVKIRIQIDRAGNVVDCSVLEAKSSKNSDFLKKRLPELAFPCFNDLDIFDPSLSFTIVFRNVETR